MEIFEDHEESLHARSQFVVKDSLLDESHFDVLAEFRLLAVDDPRYESNT